MKTYFTKNNILTISLLIINTAIFFSLSSCNKEDNDTDSNNAGTVINDNYYVKYVISSNYPKIFSNWSVTTPQGKYSKNDYQTRYWQQTYGPVKKGFKCEVLVEKGEPTIEIYSSKNQEPFTLKVTKTGSSASYNIDF